MKQGGVWAIFESASFFFLPQSLSTAQRSPLNKGRVEGWRTWWLWLEVIYDHKLHFYRVMCSSFTTCGERCCMTGLITFFAGNVNLWEAVALCCLQDESELLHLCARTHTMHDRISIQTSRCVFRNPSDRSVCLTPLHADPHLSQLSHCSLRTILPACSPRLQRVPPPVCPFCTFPPLLMKIND